MIIEVKIDDRGDHLAALKKALERYNVESAGAPGFAVVPDEKAFVQRIVDNVAESYAERYLRRPQTFAEALNRIAELEAENSSLSARASGITTTEPAPVSTAPGDGNSP